MNKNYNKHENMYISMDVLNKQYLIAVLALLVVGGMVYVAFFDGVSGGAIRGFSNFISPDTTTMNAETSQVIVEEPTQTEQPVQGTKVLIEEQTLTEQDTEEFPPSETTVSTGEAIKFTGELIIYHVDDFENPENSGFVYYLKTADKTYELFSVEELPVMRSGAIVSVYGIATDNVITISSNYNSASQLEGNFAQESTLVDARNTLRFLSVTATRTLGQFTILRFPPPTQKSENLGPQSTLVIVAGIGNDPPPATAAELDQLIFSYNSQTLQDYYIKNSYDKTSLVGKVVGPYTLPGTVCSLLEIKSAAIAAADNDVYFPDYGRIIFVTPGTPCLTVARGTIGKVNVDTPDGTIRASESYIVSDPGNVGLFVLAHELGHNFGALHGNVYFCFDPQVNIVPYSFQCESWEYGDFFDVMGTRLGHFNAAHKEEVGWLTSQNSIVTTQGTYALKPLELVLPPGEIQQIKMPIDVETNHYVQEDDLYYSIEFRQPFDYDTGLDQSIYEGVLIRIAKFNDNDFTFLQTNLVSMTNPAIKKESLQMGESYIDQIHGYKITVNSVTQDEAQVTIEQIPRIRVDFDKPLIYLDFDDGIVNDVWPDKAGYIAGAELKGEADKTSEKVAFFSMGKATI